MIELIGDLTKLVIADLVEVDPLGKVLAQQPVCVLVAATLPGRVRGGEVDAPTGRHLDGFVVKHLIVLVPR